MPEISTSGIILTEVPFKLCLLLLIYISIRAFKLKKTVYYAAGGAVWAAACLFRPTIALYPAVIFIIWLLHRYPLKEMVKYTAAAVAVFSVIMAPWWIRNYIAFDRFIPLTLSSGNPFLQGTYINYDQSKDTTPYLRPLDGDISHTNQVEIDTGRMRFAKYIREKPLQYIYWYTIGKTLYFWRLPFYWKHVFGIHAAFVAVYHYLILGTWLFSAAFCIRRKVGYGIFLLLVILYFNLVYLPYFTSERYAYPIMPLVIILAAYVPGNLVPGSRYSGKRVLD
jgi:4-amino-4-deoxy-L-arabinose transferase-like glycosyltransferase